MPRKILKEYLMEIPAILIGASVVIALASLALHFLFPPSSGQCPMKSALTHNPLEKEPNQKEG
jgi:hypothetical protein